MKQNNKIVMKFERITISKIDCKIFKLTLAEFVTWVQKQILLYLYIKKYWNIYHATQSWLLLYLHKHTFKEHSQKQRKKGNLSKRSGSKNI